MNNKQFWSVDRNGEISDLSVNNILNEKHRPDNAFDRGIIAIIVMAFCFFVDLTIFRSLFAKIAYDSVVMQGVQIGGMLLCYDILPVYLGIMLRRKKANLSSSTLMMYLCIAAFVGAFAVNIVLRLQTVSLIAPPPDLIDEFGNELSEIEATAALAASSKIATAQTLFAVIVPLLTSISSFVISYVTFDPLKLMQKRYEKLLGQKADELRRVRAIISEYDKEPNFEQNLRDDEAIKFAQTSLEQRSKLAKYMLYSRGKLIEAVNDPAATSAISSDTYETLLNKVNATLDSAKGGDLFH